MKYIITEEQFKGINKTIIKLIDTEGILNASDIVGGYDTLKELLGNYEIRTQLKIDTIKKFMSQRAATGFHLGEYDEEPIPYFENNDGYHQIEYLGPSKAIINVWGGYNGQTDLGEYGVSYGDLPEKSLDDIIEMLINHY
jgi:hypothetical protein